MSASEENDSLSPSRRGRGRRRGQYSSMDNPDQQVELSEMGQDGATSDKIGSTGSDKPTYQNGTGPRTVERVRNGPRRSGTGSNGSVKTALLDERSRKNFKTNRYAANKTAGQAATNLALLTTNAAQLKGILDTGPRHVYYVFFVSFLAVSIALQVGLGFMLLWVGSRENKLKQDSNLKTKKTERINNLCIFVIIAVSILNVVLSAFAVASSQPEPDSQGINSTHM